MSRWWPLMAMAVLALVLACSRDESAGASGGERADAMPASARSAAAAAAPWQDPEPDGAQQLAEKVRDAEWNRDKTSRLSMHITTLLRPTSGIEGLRSGLASGSASLDERLSRLGATRTATEITIRLAGAVLFDFDSAVIRADAERTMAAVAEVLRELGDAPARVEGHTDSIGFDAYNQTLSERRAVAVADWLAGHGVPRARLRTVGHGESRPVADNGSGRGRQQNRRVEVVIARE